jgi:hypothetical protein
MDANVHERQEPLVNNPVHDRYLVVYWSTEGVDFLKIWSFHIAKFRAGATAFDDKFDTPLNLAEAGLRVFVKARQVPSRSRRALSSPSKAVRFISCTDKRR